MTRPGQMFGTLPGSPPLPQEGCNHLPSDSYALIYDIFNRGPALPTLLPVPTSLKTVRTSPAIDSGDRDSRKWHWRPGLGKVADVEVVAAQKPRSFAFAGSPQRRALRRNATHDCQRKARRHRECFTIRGWPRRAHCHDGLERPPVARHHRVSHMRSRNRPRPRIAAHSKLRGHHVCLRIWRRYCGVLLALSKKHQIPPGYRKVLRLVIRRYHGSQIPVLSGHQPFWFCCWDSARRKKRIRAQMRRSLVPSMRVRRKQWTAMRVDSIARVS